MKKIICLVLCFLMLCLAGCGGDKENSSSDASALGKIETVVAKGKLDGIEYGLGADIEKVKEYYSNLAAEYEKEHNDGDGHSHDMDAPFFAEDKKDGYIIYDISFARFFYEKGKESDGISAVATDGEVFGFTPGVTTKYEVEEAMTKEGESLNATEEELFFLPVRTEPVLILRYEIEDIQLDYYFYDNTLITTVISKK